MRKMSYELAGPSGGTRVGALTVLRRERRMISSFLISLSRYPFQHG